MTDCCNSSECIIFHSDGWRKNRRGCQMNGEQVVVCPRWVSEKFEVEVRVLRVSWDVSRCTCIYTWQWLSSVWIIQHFCTSTRITLKVSTLWMLLMTSLLVMTTVSMCSAHNSSCMIYYEYRICSIRRRGYYLFQQWILCGFCFRAAAIRKRHLFNTVKTHCK